MSDILILRGSPRANGATDRLAQLFAMGLSSQNSSISNLALRDFHFSPCDGCGFCAAPPHNCKYQDHIPFLFNALQNARLAVFAAPIYFYALPALCLAFMDRAQCLWNSLNGSPGSAFLPFAPAILLLAAGRKKGPKLFSGAILSLSRFFRTGKSKLLCTYAFKDMDEQGLMEQASCLEKYLIGKGQNWARFLALNRQF